MRTIAILPVKRFTLAKQRLEGALSSLSRQALAEAMVTDVIIALRRTRGIERTLVVTHEAQVANIARAHGATVIDDPREAGQSAAAGLGLERATELGFERALLIPGDCPALDPTELDALLLSAAAAPAVVIMPDRHGTGTNGLLLAPPAVIAPRFGPGSFALHSREAQESGVSCSVVELESLLLDVDTGDDLEALREKLAGGHGMAANTRGMLGPL